MKKNTFAVFLAALTVCAKTLAENIPVPTCVNGSWVAPDGWNVAYAAPCNSSAEIYPYEIDAQCANGCGVNIKATFYSEDKKPQVAITVHDYRCYAGLWNGTFREENVWCPSEGLTALANCPISKDPVEDDCED